MKRVIWGILAAVAIGIVAGGCGDPLDVATTDEGLRAEQDVQVADNTPACWGLNLKGQDVQVYVVGNAAGSGTLLVMEQGQVVCLDDASGVTKAGVPPAALPIDPNDPGDPANGTVIIIGSPPSVGGGGADKSGPDEGTPLPAVR
jgi:hypothetical protein